MTDEDRIEGACNWRERIEGAWDCQDRIEEARYCHGHVIPETG
jgi:hypothetical protein